MVGIAGTKSVAATCVSFPVTDSGSFVCGSEEGVVYPFMRSAGKAECAVEPLVGHSAPVTVCVCVIGRCIVYIWANTCGILRAGH